MAKRGAGDANGAGIAQALERLARLLRADEFAGGLNPAQREALRYLSKANRFSNSPSALAQYLAATKGTVSQTITALERKGHLTKTARAGEKRSIALELTEQGRDAVVGDPWARLAAAAGELGGKTRRRLTKGLDALLAAEITHGDHPSFGQCVTCRYFRERGREGTEGGPHLCMHFEAPLSDAETTLICAAHAAAAPK